ncbi:Palmitoyltransferase PFA4 [Pleurostoma richardsiae]|uniref:Palmitoyltransferase PFA4 n=1 Tax=Pleurostoma richardsiae TaxID=41990 RepID=A0AA38VUV3_9PEZI|nr:Palmitoyltransferase PFA4 [Pleurostoma richardsiae]
MAAGLKTGPATKGLQALAIPGVCILIFFLGYTSQWLFNTSSSLEPGPLTTSQTYTFNILLVCLWWTYYKACSVSSGEYTFPSSSPTSDTKPSSPSTSPKDDAANQPPPNPSSSSRWCKKCAAPKPLRAHHCRHCGRCVPKMDHHCPWTANCVSLQTFPYFLRFLVWTNLSLWYLATLIYARLRQVWESRDLPAYLGPSLPALIHLTLLALICAAVCLALGILLVTTVKGWIFNRTMIEGWEAERHEAVLERYARRGGWWDDAGRGSKGPAAALELEPVEFPYDVGLFRNMAQAMGTANPLLWLFPLAGGPRVARGGRGTGWDWPENGFNARSGMWPPPDPEKMRRTGGWPGAAARQAGELETQKSGSPEEERAAFRQRQAADLRRWQKVGEQSGIIAELEEDEDEEEYNTRPGEEEEDGSTEEEDDSDDDYYYEEGMDGEPGWTNSDGDRLRDYGVDEDAEVDGVGAVPLDDAEDDDVPIAELLRRRKVLTKDEG